MFNLPVKLLQRPAPSLVPVEPVGSVGRPATRSQRYLVRLSLSQAKASPRHPVPNISAPILLHSGFLARSNSNRQCGSALSCSVSPGN